jgi:RNA polymerase sigma-70 factor (ECF subfamily)
MQSREGRHRPGEWYVESMEDAELLERIRRDDPGAFEAFVERFGDRIYRFGLRMCGHREDAKDVLQDTLIQAYKSLGTLEHPQALRSWLYRVASNACLMMRRKGKFEPDRELSLEELAPGRDEGLPVEIPDPATLPDEAAEKAEWQRRVHEAIGDLPPAYRIVLIMRDIEQLSTREVGEALGLDESAVKMRLHRARLRVKQRLEEMVRGSVPGGGRA